MISQILALNEKHPKYFYIRTERELVSMARNFSKTKYRYLHISCHANAKSMATTLDRISFKHLAEILKPYLSKRRVFISACEMVNNELARSILPGSGCYSIAGPSQQIAFSDAAILWSSFYHLMFSIAYDAMKGNEIKDVFSKIANLYQVNLRYYRYDKESKRIKKYDIKENGRIIDSTVRPTERQ